MNDREIYKLLCLGSKIDIPVTLKSKLPSKISDNCRHCKEKVTEDEFDIHVGYWTPIWYPVHKNCAKACRAEEAYECQKIDAGCNDCKFFQRNTVQSETKADTAVNQFFPRINTIPGYCTRNNFQVEATPVSYQGMPCFEHRKN